MEHYKLTVNRDLIDPNFSNYKLSHEALPTCCLSLETGVDTVQLISNEFYSYQHVKAFGIQNHLFLDPWNDEGIWFIDENWLIRKIPTSKENSKFGSFVHFEIPDSCNRRLIPDRVNVTLSFASPSWCVVTDGTGWLYVLKTGDRSQNERWKEGYSGEPLGENKRFVVLHSVNHTEDKMRYLDALCLHVDKTLTKPDAASVSPFVTKLEWLTFTSADESSFVLSRTRNLQSADVPDYGVLQGTSVIVACRKPVTFSFDSLNPIADSNNVEDPNKAENLPTYTWTQNDETITVMLRLAPEVHKEHVTCKLETKHLDLRIQNSEFPLFTGELFSTIRADESKWTISEEHLLELHLCKVVVGEAWKTVVVGNDSGLFVQDPEELAAMSEQLFPYTSDVCDPNPAGEKKPYNVEQLEECDEFPEDSAAIWRIDGETHRIIQRVDISSYQWLFSGAPRGNCLPALCLRHDVDGVVWQPEQTETGSLVWRHAGMFNAFGYVQASKQDRKFTVHAPDYSYVAIVDFVRHAFVYFQPSSDVINLSTNQKQFESCTGSVAKQQVVSLDSVDPILGVQATNEKLFILTGKNLYIVCIEGGKA